MVGEPKIIAEGLRFPEGPVAMADGSVIVTEAAGGRLTRVMPDGRKITISEHTGSPNGAAMGPDGKCYVANNGGAAWREDAKGIRPVVEVAEYTGGRIERVDVSTGQVEALYTHCDGRRLNAPNDLVFDAYGGFYFTDMGKTRARDMDRGAIYYARADGSLIREVVFPALTPNGIGLSPDGRILYCADTDAARLWAFDIIAPGEIKRGRRAIAQCGGTLQFFDSLAVDSAGNICVATLINGGITVISPDGKDIRHIPMPDMFTTNICFGGPDLRTAYVTLSTTGRLAAVQWDRPGLRLNDASA
jgi:gluconolactonase